MGYKCLTNMCSVKVLLYLFDSQVKIERFFLTPTLSCSLTKETSGASMFWKMSELFKIISKEEMHEMANYRR